MKLFGKSWTRRDLQAYTGRSEQVAGIRLAELGDGRERGLRIADVSTGGGLSFTVLVDRGLDIAAASFQGVPLAFLSPADAAAPAYFDDRGINWLRSWGAGLVTGCGLRNVGSPGTVGGEEFPLHGRLSNQPARRVNTAEVWKGDAATLVLEGDVEESRLFGENLRLHRRISAPVGGNEILLEDAVENLGFAPEPVFLLYHTNWGFPMVHESATLSAVDHTVTPRDEVAAPGLGAWTSMQPPTAGYREQVFYHDIPADRDGWSTLTLRSPLAGLQAEVACRKAELPLVAQWKMMGQGAYVTGIEPANCRVSGRESELGRGPHCVLEPGASRRFALRIRVSRLGG